MKNTGISILLFTLFALGVTVESVKAQNPPDNTEIGILIGEPTGISLKFWGSGNTALDLGVAWSLGRGGAIHLHGDYLFHHEVDPELDNLLFYYGIGARALLTDDARFGARIPVGLQYIIPETRLSLFFELAPLFDLVPETEFDVNGGVGIRVFI